MEKLQLLKTPDERRRRLEEIPEIHADPKMDPSYESDEDDNETDNIKRGLLYNFVFINGKIASLVPNLLSHWSSTFKKGPAGPPISHYSCIINP